MKMIEDIINVLVLAMIATGILSIVFCEIGSFIKGEDIFDRLGNVFNKISNTIKGAFSLFKRKT